MTLNWELNTDLDLRANLREADTDEYICETFYRMKAGCGSMSLDVDSQTVSNLIRLTPTRLKLYLSAKCPLTPYLQRDQIRYL